MTTIGDTAMGNNVGAGVLSRSTWRPRSRQHVVFSAGYADTMSDHRKRAGPSGLSSRTRRRRRHCEEEHQRAMVMAAVAAVLVAVGVISSGMAHAQAPRVRRPIYEAKRLDWEEHAGDLDERDGWRRSYRMDKDCFYKLAELLRPLLEVNAYFASLRSPTYGVISVEVRLAIALRILAGGAAWDAAILFGLGLSTVYDIFWQVVDAINKADGVGRFYFPQDEDGCRRHADRFEVKSTDGVFSHVVAAVDGLFIKAHAPTPKDTANVMAYFSGSKNSYGMNVQAMCTADYRFCAVSAISPGSTNDWMAWGRSSLSRAVARLPGQFHIIGDAAYPISAKLLTPYPGKSLPPGEDAFNFYLSQLRVKIEQSFGILVSTWGILWRPLKVQFVGRGDVITALFHLHNYLRDEKVEPVQVAEEDSMSGSGRPPLCPVNRTLESSWETSEKGGAATRSGDTPMRAAIRTALEVKKQWRPDYNLARNG